MSKLSKEERLTRLLKSKQTTNISWDDIDTELARQITYVEMKLGFPIYKDYPLMKFLQEADDIRYFDEQERNAMRK